MSLRTPCSVALLLFVAGSATPKFDAATEEQRLLLRDAEWARLASAGTDVDKTVAYWSDDALIIPQAGRSSEGARRQSGLLTVGGTTRRAPEARRTSNALQGQAQKRRSRNELCGKDRTCD